VCGLSDGETAPHGWSCSPTLNVGPRRILGIEREIISAPTDLDRI
jgi:hypothetical protein